MPIKFLLWLFALMFAASIHFYIRTFYPQDLLRGFYMQIYSSENIMQTLPMQQLHDAPLINLYYLHIQPPMLDTIRALLAAISPFSKGLQLEHFVDGGLYILWAFLYAALALLIFTWIYAATGSAKIAGTSYTFWLFNPGALAMAMLLESTLLSSLLTTWTLYELWQFSERRGSEWRLTIATILLFLTRTVFQWPFAIVFLAALYMANIPGKSLFKIFIPFFVVLMVFLGKQFILFDTFYTTTYAGEHKLGLIQYHPAEAEIAKYRLKLNYKYPTGAQSYQARSNNEEQVLTNIIYSQIASDRLSHYFAESLQGITKSVILNGKQMIKPISRYQNSFPFFKRLFWRDFSDFILITPLYLSLILAFAVWLRRNRSNLKGTYPKLAPALIAFYVVTILLIANRYDWTEVDRLKFLLEPTIYVFVIVQFSSMFRRKPTVPANCG